MIFDGCEINFCGYSDTTSAGYLTAQSANATKDGQEASGYVFRNCFISYNKDRKVTPGSWGRMWGANCTVAFLNTQLEDKEMILNPGWVAMSGNDPTSTGVNLVEYNTTYCGEAVDTTGRVAGTVVNAIDINDYSVETIFADRWTPTYYTGDVTTAPEFKTKPALTSNGDLNAPNPGETVTVVYEFGDDWKDEDASQIIWYAVPENSDLTSLENILKTAVVLKSTSASISNSFQIPMECAGNYIMAVVIPVTNNGMKNTAEYALRTEKVVSNVWTDPTGETPIAPGSGINIYLAGDSTVKDYSIKGMYNGGKILNEGSWGEYLQEFFDAEFVTINNYAQGGRATRSFINEGKLDNILKNIKKGDYLFIQFGHNDCSNGTAYYLDRFVPLYTADNPATESGYPTIVPTESMRTATPDALKNNILSSTYYAWDCGATYKGFLQYYIDRALEKEAIPVVVSPVSRTYFDDNGKIRAHHDSNATDCELTKNLLTSNNAYATACEEIYNENKDKGVLYLDAFNITKSLYEKAYSDTGSKQAVSDIMSLGDSTHSSKTGGVIQAGLIAEWIKNNNLSISKYVKAPTSVYGEKPDGEFIFEIDENGKFKAKNNDYAVSDYWTSYGQALFETLDVAIEETTTETTTEITTETTTETTTEPSTEMVKYGDVDSDGDIDANDAARTLSYVRNKDLPLTLREIVAAKLGFDKVTATNAAMILKKAKNLDYNFPNGESGNIEKDPAQLKEITLLH